MVRFYDAKDEADLARVEAVLKRAGIEYSLRDSSQGEVAKEVQVAEEDIPQAEELLQSTTRAGGRNERRQ